MTEFVSLSALLATHCTNATAPAFVRLRSSISEVVICVAPASTELLPQEDEELAEELRRLERLTRRRVAIRYFVISGFQQRAREELLDVARRVLRGAATAYEAACAV